MIAHGLKDRDQFNNLLEKSMADATPFDLIILNVQLQDSTGYDVLKDIRNMPSPYSNVSVLSISASGLIRTKEHREAGFDGFLPTPVHGKKLIDMVKRLLCTREAPEDDEAKNRIFTRHTVAEEAKHSIRILLVEDNPINQKLAKFILLKAGYQLDIAGNGKEAVEMFIAAPDSFDIILMDIQMPIMDGKEATKIIRAKGFDTIPIIAVTADVMKGEKEKLLSLGMNDYIPKPIKRDVVFKMVKKWT